MRCLRFGPLPWRSVEHQQEGQPVSLPPQPLRVLTFLVERAGGLATREELREAIWGDGHVELWRSRCPRDHPVPCPLGGPHHPTVGQLEPPAFARQRRGVNNGRDGNHNPGDQPPGSSHAERRVNAHRRSSGNMLWPLRSARWLNFGYRGNGPRLTARTDPGVNSPAWLCLRAMRGSSRPPPSDQLPTATTNPEWNSPFSRTSKWIKFVAIRRPADASTARKRRERRALFGGARDEETLRVADGLRARRLRRPE